MQSSKRALQGVPFCNMVENFKCRSDVLLLMGSLETSKKIVWMRKVDFSQ